MVLIRLAPRKEADPNFTFENLACERSADCKLAPDKSEPFRSAFAKLAPANVAPLMSVLDIVIEARFAFTKLAPVKLESRIVASGSSAKEKSELSRDAAEIILLSNLPFLKSASSIMRPFKVR